LRKLLTIFFIILYSGSSISGQTTPDPPTLNFVSVEPDPNPELNYTHFSWNPSASLDVVAYIIHIWTGPNETRVVDTIIGRDSNYWIDSLNWGWYGSESYSISAINSLSGDGKESKLTDPDTTMFLKAIFDPCQGSMELNWNPYGGWGDSLSHYTIYKNKSNGSFEPISPNTINISYDDEEVTPYNRYCYYIEATHLDGRKSTSNMSCDSSNMPRPPAYISPVGSTFIEDKVVELTFYVDPATELSNYKLVRSESVSGIFDTINTINISGGEEIILTDEIPEDKSYYYYLLAMNDCGLLATRSGLNSIIHLNGENSGFYNALVWNSFVDWPGGVNKYYIYRKSGNGEYEVIDSLSATDTSYTDNINDIIYSIDLAEFCYYIVAKEGNGNPFGAPGLSQSNTVCLYPQPVIYMPNAFTPNGDGINDEFIPVLTFTPKEYYFIIRSQWGNTIFETEDPNVPWNGEFKGGMVNEGVFVYYLKVIDQNDQMIEKKGQLMVLYPAD